MFFQPRIPDNELDPELEAAIEAFRTAGQTILFGSFVILGFQIFCQYEAVILQRAGSSRYVHLASIVLIVLTILWVGPVAFPSEAMFAHGLEPLYRVGKRNLMLVTMLLGAGISADVYVMTRMAAHSYALAIALATAMLALGFALGFGVPHYLTNRKGPD